MIWSLFIFVFFLPFPTKRKQTAFLDSLFLAEMVGVEPTRRSRDLKHFECSLLRPLEYISNYELFRYPLRQPYPLPFR